MTFWLACFAITATGALILWLDPHDPEAPV